jgi:hypothetical protein
MANDPATINTEGTNEKNTDVDRWADARRLRINGKPCSKPWRYLNLPVRFAGSRQRYCGGHDMRLPLTIRLSCMRLGRWGCHPAAILASGARSDDRRNSWKRGGCWRTRCGRTRTRCGNLCVRASEEGN